MKPMKNYLTYYFIGSLAALILLITIFTPYATCKRQEIVVWHSMDSVLGNIFNELVETYNNQPEVITSKVKIVPVFKGNYDQSLDALCQAAGTPQAPHAAQIFEMGTLVMHQKTDVHGHPLFKSLTQVMKSINSPLSEHDFVPSIGAFYKARASELLSLPFNASTVVLFYNKSKLNELGHKPPQTWEEFEELAENINKSVGKRLLGAGWMHGHMIDQTGARHNQPVATHGNGIDSNQALLCLNTPFFIDHLTSLQRWYEQGFLTLASGPQAETEFANEDIIFLTQGANRLPILESKIKTFEIGIAAFPYWAKHVDQPYNTIAGGASFWAINGYDDAIYKSLAHFFEYLVSVKTQMQWHLKSGYLPVIQKAHEAIYNEQSPYSNELAQQAARIAFTSLFGDTVTENTRGILLPRFNEIRKIMLDEMLAAIEGKRSPEEALSNITELGNSLLTEVNES
jgi:sn-glycerol 3-phosphate transport system substrate-binding protein